MINDELLKDMIADGDLEEFKDYIWKDTDLRNQRIEGNNLLHLAIYHQAIDIVEFLLKEKYYDINEQNGDGQTPINMAMSEFNQDAEDTVEMIFKYYSDIDVDTPDRLGRNALLAGMMSGIAGRYTMLVAEKTTNLEQLDSEMNETVVDACIRNEGMYRQHAQILTMYIQRGANISKQQLMKIMGLISDNKYSTVKKSLEGRKDLEEDILYLASEGGFEDFLPQAAKDVFLF
jgi:ankyrin repeat protein